MQQPLVTVGIPTYNRPEGLDNTLKNVMAQTYKNLEIIVSDNVSTDAEKVAAVVKKYQEKGMSISFFRQEKNLGSIGNFHFLANQANGDFFLWAADDDDIDPTYVQELLSMFDANKKLSIAMTGYEVIDQMSQPEIRSVLTKYLAELESSSLYERLYKYVVQPDHYGKSRLVWGMFHTSQIVRAFKECFDKLSSDITPIWADLPIEMRLLSYGELKVSENILFHAYLLPTSDGKQGFSGQTKKLLGLLKRSTKAYSHVVKDSKLTDAEKKKLLAKLKIKEVKNAIEVYCYYKFQRLFPGAARWVKKVIFQRLNEAKG